MILNIKYSQIFYSHCFEITWMLELPISMPLLDSLSWAHYNNPFSIFFVYDTNFLRILTSEMMASPLLLPLFWTLFCQAMIVNNPFLAEVAAQTAGKWLQRNRKFPKEFSSLFKRVSLMFMCNVEKLKCHSIGIYCFFCLPLFVSKTRTVQNDSMNGFDLIGKWCFLSFKKSSQKFCFWKVNPEIYPKICIFCWWKFWIIFYHSWKCWRNVMVMSQNVCLLGKI